MGTLFAVKAVLILDNDGERVLCKYYDPTYPSAKEQRRFEKALFAKTSKANAEIIMFEGLTCVYRSNIDVFFYVVGGPEENELLLVSVLNTYYEAVSQLLRNQVEKRVILDNLGGVILVLDELVDGGVILESDSSALAMRAVIRGGADDIPLSEQTLGQALLTAREQLARTLLK